MKTYFASCPKRSEEWLEEELKTLGAKNIEKKNGGVQFKAENEAALKILFETRLASRMYLLLDVYPIMNEKDVYGKVNAKWWHKVFDNNQTFKIQTLFDTDAHNFFKNSMHFSMMVKDAIVDQFRSQTGRRPNVDTSNPDISLLVRVEGRGREPGFNAKFYLDMTNVPLSDRGYRRGKHQAPLRENLAAILIHISKWDPKKAALSDMFCGSGTILIEAAMIQMSLPPTYIKIKKARRGRTTDFAFLNHKWFQDDKNLQKWVSDYFEKVTVMADKVKESKSQNLIGGDRDISFAIENIRAAGLEGHIKLIETDFKSFKPDVDTEGLVLITNPPYGERLEGGEELYYQIGEALKNNFKRSDAFVLTSDDEYRKKIFLKSTRKYPLFNGPIDCRLMHYEVN
jgi:23S rRNA G2445 N2-methylase RlmL